MRGFTLIELITVIIILGILSAVVAPRYFDMTSEAESSASQQALAEGVVQFNLAFMKYVVDNKAPPADLDAMSGIGYLDLDGNDQMLGGDYRFTYTHAGSIVTVAAERSDGSGGWKAAQSRTIDWP